MAVVFRRFDLSNREYREVGVVINREYYGEETNPVQALNFDFEGWEDALVDEFQSKQFHAEKRPDDEIDLDTFRDMS